VVGVRLYGELPEGATATDLVLTVTELLRKKGVVGKFVEFYGPGLANLALEDMATIANMAPEYGATCGFFPVSGETLDYLKSTARPASQIALVEAYARAQGMFWTAKSPDPVFTDTLALDLATVEPSMAGPKRPQDRVTLKNASTDFARVMENEFKKADELHTRFKVDGSNFDLGHGDVVIAAITSCTNTSNPSVMIGAGLLARNAVKKGLTVKPWVKTSLAPGSKVVTQYYEAAGLTPFLDQLGFQLVGYGCTTCIGNSGPLPEEISQAIQDRKLVAAAALSGNRNFEGRINSDVRANYLMSPPLVVAFAIAGRIDIDLTTEPLGTGTDGSPVFLRDIWPSQREIEEVLEGSIRSQMYRDTYASVFEGDSRWKGIAVPGGDRFAWQADSTYVRQPTYFDDMPEQAPAAVPDITGARAIALLGDSVTTDHISPAGSIKSESPAGRYLVEHGVAPRDFNSYGSRRGNHEVMVRGTFANTRIRNLLAPGTEGGFSTYLPTGEVMSIFDAAMRYQADGTPLLVVAGKEYGSGSSRDWAAKGPYLQGIRFVIAESYERIHRSNLVGMGILPLQFQPGDTAASLGITGRETFDVVGLARRIADGLAGGRDVEVRATREDGSHVTFKAIVRIDTPQEVLYYRHGGILQFVLRQLLRGKEKAPAVSGGLAAGHVMPPGETPSRSVDEGSLESFPASDPPSY
jgi:aconitate hydratase